MTVNIQDHLGPCVVEGVGGEVDPRAGEDSGGKCKHCLILILVMFDKVTFNLFIYIYETFLGSILYFCLAWPKHKYKAKGLVWAKAEH